MNYQDHIDKFYAAELASLDEGRRQGRKVAASFCRFFPIEILAGFELQPLRVTTGGDFEAEHAGEKFVRPDACPYCKSIIGNFALGRNIHVKADMVIGVITCDMMRRTLYLAESEFKIPMFPVYMPATFTKNSEKYFTSQILSTVENLKRSLKRDFDPGRCRDFADARRKCATILWKISISGKYPPMMVHGLLHLFQFSNPGRLLSFLKQITKEFKPRSYVQKILLTGSCSCLEDDIVPRILEKRGIGMIPSGSSGLSSLEYYTSLKIKGISDRNLVSHLAVSLFNSPACIRQRPNKRFYRTLEENIKSTKCDAVILKTLKFCDLWYTEKERMKESLDVPLLVLDTTYSDSDRERTSNRIEAFLEII